MAARPALRLNATHLYRRVGVRYSFNLSSLFTNRNAGATDGAGGGQRDSVAVEGFDAGET